MTTHRGRASRQWLGGSGGAIWVVGALRVAGAALMLVGLVAVLSGCESTQEKSAHLEAVAKREKAAHPEAAQTGLSIAHASTQVRVTQATVVHDSEGTAAAVTLTNSSSHTLASIPIAITVRGATGQTVYQNNTPGLEFSLTHLASLPAHATATWVDDQVSTTGEPTSVSATVGEAPAAIGAGSGGGSGTASGSGATSEPPIAVQGVHLAEASTGEVSGTVHNGSSVAQRQLVVYVVARHGGQIVAAGRAVLPEVAVGASLPFHAFLIGSPAGAQLEASAPATTFG